VDSPLEAITEAANTKQFDRLVREIRCLPCCPAVQAAGFAACAVLALTENAARLGLMESGAHLAAVVGMASNLNDTDVQAHGSRALGNLACGSGASPTISLGCNH
jgi:hypothetical protein